MVSGVTSQVGVAVQRPQRLLVSIGVCLIGLGLGVAGVLLVGVGVDAEREIFIVIFYQIQIPMNLYS